MLALNKGNKVNTLSPAQIKDVFDEEITNWKELGGEDLPIRVFRLEDITEYYTEEELGPAYEYAGERITQLVEKTPGIVAFVPQKFIVQPDAVHFIKDNTISVKDVFAGAEWFPTATPAALFGFLPLIAGTLWVSLFAILFALPFGLSVSIPPQHHANIRCHGHRFTFYVYPRCFGFEQDFLRLCTCDFRHQQYYDACGQDQLPDHLRRCLFAE